MLTRYFISFREQEATESREEVVQELELLASEASMDIEELKRRYGYKECPLRQSNPISAVAGKREQQDFGIADAALDLTASACDGPTASNGEEDFDEGDGAQEGMQMRIVVRTGNKTTTTTMMTTMEASKSI